MEFATPSRLQAPIISDPRLGIVHFSTQIFEAQGRVLLTMYKIGAVERKPTFVTLLCCKHFHYFHFSFFSFSSSTTLSSNYYFYFHFRAEQTLNRWTPIFAKKIILQHFSRYTRFTLHCIASMSKFQEKSSSFLARVKNEFHFIHSNLAIFHLNLAIFSVNSWCNFVGVSRRL